MDGHFLFEVLRFPLTHIKATTRRSNGKCSTTQRGENSTVFVRRNTDFVLGIIVVQ